MNGKHMAPRKRSFAALGVALLGAMLLPGCANSPKDGTSAQVVATHSILGDIVHNVAGDKMTVVTLVGPGGDAHTFEPSPQDAATLARANIIFENGVGFETWLDKLYRSSGSKARRVVVTDGLTFIEADDDHGPKSGSKDHAHEKDPHVWHDVKNVIHMTHRVRDALCERDPANQATYQANAAAYEKQLQELDAYVVKQTEMLPKERRKLVTSHDTFGYFAKRYGFEILGTALPSFSTEASDPSAAQLAKLVEEIKKAGVPAIFAENIQNPKLMQRIAIEAGVKLGPSLYTDALGDPGSSGETYVKMMRANVDSMVTALKP